MRSPHSFRHTLVTASRQLGHDAAKTNELGHWAVSSAMPQRYDSTWTTSQLLSKADILQQIRSGWQLVGPGEVPKPRVVPQHNDEPPQKRRRDAEAPPPERLKPMLEFRLVRHKGTKRLHIWIDGKTSQCGFRGCGTPDEPAEMAKYLSENQMVLMKCGRNDTAVCKPCYRALGSKLKIPDTPTDDRPEDTVQPPEMVDDASEGGSSSDGDHGSQ